MASYHLKTIVASLMFFFSLAQPLAETLDWEDFQAALVEDGGDEGITLLQAKANIRKIKLPAASEESKRKTDLEEDSSGALDDISPDDFADTMSEEKVPEAVSLIQTEAHIERTSVHTSIPVSMVTKADGSNVAETKATLPQDGILHMSVGGDGSFTWEGATEGLSLIQKEASLKTEGSKKEGIVEELGSTISSELMQDERSEGISLLQTDARKQAVVTKADGSIVMESATPQADDGMMHMFVGADGSSEAVSLLQRDAKKEASLKVEVPKDSKSTEAQAAKDAQSSMNDVSPDSFAQALKSSTEPSEAVAFIQTDAHVEKRAVVTQADGSITLQREKARHRDGIVHMSVGTSGAFHWEA